jgi:AraC-like DNA-binding protein
MNAPELVCGHELDHPSFGVENGDRPDGLLLIRWKSNRAPSTLHRVLLSQRSRAARLRRVVELVDANLGRPLPLAELSLVVHMSPFHFAAKILLAQPGRIHTVVTAVGFRSPSHFTTMFRRVVGFTPVRYRMLAGNVSAGGAAETGFHCPPPRNAQ